MARRTRHVRVSVAVALGVGLACEPIAGTPQAAAPTNSCPAYPCSAYRQPGPAPTCNSSGVCTVAAPTSNLLLIIGLATDAYFAPGRTYVTTLNGGPSASGPCALFDCSPPACALPRWVLDQGSYLIDQAEANEANWYLGGVLTTLPVQATYRFYYGVPPADALDLGLPVEPVLATNVTGPPRSSPPGPDGTPQIQFKTYLQSRQGGQSGCYERTLQPFAPFSRAFPPEIKLWPSSDAMQTSGFDLTKVTGSVNGTLPKFDISRQAGLEGWTVYLRNSQTKRVFSNVVPLTGSFAPGITLLTNHVHDEALTGLEVVLAPPADQPLPTEFFAPVDRELTSSLMYPLLPTPVTVTGRIRTPAGTPVPADVYFTAVDISDRSGQKFPPNFEFSTHASTTLDPHTGASIYSVLVPQGDYQIVVRPADGVNAVETALRLVGGQGNEMTGQDFDVTPLVPVSGSAALADGRALAEAIVEALPTQCFANVGDAAASPAPSDACLPNVAQTVTATDGSFHLTADPGEYRLRIRPRDGSRLPWKIVPMVVGETPAVTGSIVIPAPISVGMRLTDSAGAHNPVSNAVVRVFTDPSQGGSAVELGRAITDAQGNYEMYIAPPDQ